MSVVSNLKDGINVVLRENEVKEISYHMVYNYVSNGRFSDNKVSGEINMTKVKTWLNEYIDKKLNTSDNSETVSEIVNQLK